MNSIQLLIKDICEEENIGFQAISKEWVLMLTKNDEAHYIVGSKFDLNSFPSARICNDKYACYDALRVHGLPVCEHRIFYSDYTLEEVKECFKEFKNDVVVKPNSGSYGEDIYHVKDIDSLCEKMNLLFQKHYSISLCPFYSILCEYRLIVLKGEVELVFGKKRPIVVGDGVHTIHELLCEFNYPYFKDIQDSKYDRVLEEGEVFEYGWQHNLSKGSIPFPVEDKELIEKLSKIAKDAVKALNLGFVSVDIVELENHEFKILEINSGVITNISDYFENGEEKAKEVYRKAVLAMFEK